MLGSLSSLSHEIHLSAYCNYFRFAYLIVWIATAFEKRLKSNLTRIWVWMPYSLFFLWDLMIIVLNTFAYNWPFHIDIKQRQKISNVTYLVGFLCPIRCIWSNRCCIWRKAIATRFNSLLFGFNQTGLNHNEVSSAIH